MELELKLLELLLLSELAVLLLFWEVCRRLGLVRVAGAAGMDPVALAECVGLMFCVAASFANSLWITLLTSSNPIFPITKGSLLSSTDFIIRLKRN